MKKMYFSLVGIFILLGLTGCAQKEHIINYAPSSLKTVKGSMNVGDFNYLPAEKNIVKANQIKNTAMGSIYFEKNINTYIENAIFAESRFVGINIDENSNKTIHGDINEFIIDDLGYNIDWTLDITYKIDNCYNKSQQIKKKTPKLSNVFGSLNEVIKLNIEKIFEDPKFKECIR